MYNAIKQTSQVIFFLRFILFKLHTPSSSSISQRETSFSREIKVCECISSLIGYIHQSCRKQLNTYILMPDTLRVAQDNVKNSEGQIFYHDKYFPNHCLFRIEYQRTTLVRRSSLCDGPTFFLIHFSSFFTSPALYLLHVYVAFEIN